jgi:2,3-bisphosphoglycerate-dependent phosphoglycerate mutase
MKKLFILILVLGCLFNTAYATYENSDSTTITTFILVRHAEKADSSPNTNLSEAGKNRAHALAKLLSKVKVDAIYTTPLNRTQQTAQFVAELNQLTIQSYDMDAHFRTLTDALTKKHAGKTVLLVGHSNTLPVNIARLTNTEISIPESDFDNVFIIQVPADGTPAKMLQLKYGE